MEDNKELLQEINERLIRIEKFQKAERTRSIIQLAVVAVLLIILAIIIVPKVITMAEQYRELMQRINGISAEFEGIAAEFESFKSKIEGIDFQGLKDTVDRMQSFFNSLSGIFNF